MTLVTPRSPQPWPAAPNYGPALQVTQRLEGARNFWLATTRPDSRPHVVALWGVWLENAFYCQGAPSSQWVKNLAANPAAALHLESGKEVVIVNGTAALVYTDAEVAATIAARWLEKYGDMAPQADQSGVIRLTPLTMIAWGGALADAVRWTFPAP